MSKAKKGKSLPKNKNPKTSPPPGASPLSGVPPPEHSRWKKGQSGNPGGMSPETEEFKKLRNLTKSELTDVMNIVIKGDFNRLIEMNDEIQKAVAQGVRVEHSALTAMLVRSVIVAVKKGDVAVLNTLLDRMVGKVKDKIEHSGNARMPIVTVTLPSNGREAKA